MPRAAATSPRRSVRARQQPSIAPSQSNSVSSNSSNRAERNTRHSNKPASPQKSSTPQSLSSEEVSEPTRASNSEPPQPRRSKRQLDIDEEDATITEEAVEDEIIEDEETTRCMCGQLDYPGPPVDAPAGITRGAKNASPPDDLPDEISGLFIQCDDCLVWQHGGCVSIMEQSAVPENYYCEECKPELHHIFKSATGQKYSRYLPVWEKTHPKSHRKMSIVKETIENKPASKDKDKDKDKERAPRTNASASAEPFGKRRSTMNSRAAYDEDEVLRKVLEESKAEGTSVTDGGASRKGKRTRDDSEDIKSDIKRQRTISSPGSLSRSEAGSSDEEGQDATSSKSTKKTPRGAAARSQKEKEQREQREKDRIEAANKRKGRADRRRADDAESEQPEESAIKTSSSNAKSSPVNENTPETPNLPAPLSSKRGGKRPGAGRGRGNYHAAADHDARPSPMDIDIVEAGPSNHFPTSNGTGKRGGRKAAQHHSNEHTTDSDKDVPLANGANSTGTDTDANGGRPPTSDPSNNHTPSTTNKGKEPSMLELKRRAIAMLDYVERAQLEIAKSIRKEGTRSPVKVGLMSPEASPSALAVAISANGSVSGDVEPSVRDILPGENLKEMIVGWQAEYGGGTPAAH